MPLRPLLRSWSSRSHIILPARVVRLLHFSSANCHDEQKRGAAADPSVCAGARRTRKHHLRAPPSRPEHQQCLRARGHLRCCANPTSLIFSDPSVCAGARRTRKHHLRAPPSRPEHQQCLRARGHLRCCANSTSLIFSARQAPRDPVQGRRHPPQIRIPQDAHENSHATLVPASAGLLQKQSVLRSRVSVCLCGTLLSSGTRRARYTYAHASTLPANQTSRTVTHTHTHTHTQHTGA
jgi:hypothetical protein